jgi:hypothetical protein
MAGFTNKNAKKARILSKSWFEIWIIKKEREKQDYRFMI